MTRIEHPLAAPLAAALDGDAGRVALARAVRAVMRHDGAPTRPGGPTGPLEDRWRTGEPLAEDTDWRAPLGPFRDPHVVRGTLGELCAARLASGTFAGDVLLALLVPFARDVLRPGLADALDDADADARCHAVLAAVVADRALRPLVETGLRPPADLGLHPGASPDR